MRPPGWKYYRKPTLKEEAFKRVKLTIICEMLLERVLWQLSNSQVSSQSENKS